jgi:O-antigen/teichoic acid export membrane protein
MSTPAPRGRLARLLAGERHGAESVLASGISALAIFAAAVFLARVLGPEGRGRVAAHLAGIATSAAIGSLGVNYAAGFAAARTGRSRAALFSVLRLAAASLAATVAVDLAIELLVVRAAAPAELLWSLGGAFAAQLASVVLGWVQGSSAIRVWNVLRVAPYVLQAAVLLALAAVGTLDVVSAVAAFTVSQAAVTLYFFATFSRRAERGAAAALSTAEIWRFSRGIALSAVLYQINQRLDQLWLAALALDADLGVYASAVTLAGLGLPFAAGLAQATYAQGLHADAEGRRALTRRRLAFAVLATAACAVALSLAAPWLMAAVYGAAFARGGVSLAILSWGTVCLAGNYVAAESLRSSGRSAATLPADGVAVLVSLVGLPLAIPRFGIAGAAAVSLLAYAVGFGINWNATRRAGGRGLSHAL